MSDMTSSELGRLVRGVQRKLGPIPLEAGFEDRIISLLRCLDGTSPRDVLHNLSRLGVDRKLELLVFFSICHMPVRLLPVGWAGMGRDDLSFLISLVHMVRNWSYVINHDYTDTITLYRTTL